VEDFFQLHEAMAMYYRLYRKLQGRDQEDTDRPATAGYVKARGVARVPGQGGYARPARGSAPVPNHHF
jgi:hypothetical protein